MQAPEAAGVQRQRSENTNASYDAEARERDAAARDRVTGSQITAWPNAMPMADITPITEPLLRDVPTANAIPMAVATTAQIMPPPPTPMAVAITVQCMPPPPAPIAVATTAQLMPSPPARGQSENANASNEVAAQERDADMARAGATPMVMASEDTQTSAARGAVEAILDEDYKNLLNLLKVLDQGMAQDCRKSGKTGMTLLEMQDTPVIIVAQYSRSETRLQRRFYFYHFQAAHIKKFTVRSSFESLLGAEGHLRALAQVDSTDQSDEADENELAAWEAASIAARKKMQMPSRARGQLRSAGQSKPTDDTAAVVMSDPGTSGVSNTLAGHLSRRKLQRRQRQHTLASSASATAALGDDMLDGVAEVAAQSDDLVDGVAEDEATSEPAERHQITMCLSELRLDHGSLSFLCPAPRKMADSATETESDTMSVLDLQSVHGEPLNSREQRHFERDMANITQSFDLLRKEGALHELEKESYMATINELQHEVQRLEENLNELEEGHEEQLGSLNDNLEKLKRKYDDAMSQLQQLRKDVLSAEKTPMELVSLMMQASFIRPGALKADNFMPKEQDLLLLLLQPNVVAGLHHGTLRQFYDALFPQMLKVRTWAAMREAAEQTPAEHKSLDEAAKHSIFYHSGTAQESFMIFKDQMKRAEELAIRVQQLLDAQGAGSKIPVTLRILDGHGRMLLCILKALIDLKLDPDECVSIEVYEVDSQVDKYHRRVFPQCVIHKFKSIIDVSKRWGRTL